jgi:hypothetical protein
VAGFPHVLDMRGGFGGETDEMGRVTFRVGRSVVFRQLERVLQKIAKKT